MSNKQFFFVIRLFLLYVQFLLNKLQIKGEIMLKKYLPTEIYDAINMNLNFNDLNEIRLRVDCPVVICVKNKKFFLGEKGFSNYKDAIICTSEMLQDFVYKACDKSIYAVNDNLKFGFITLPYGIRVGICGEVVSNEQGVSTIKNFQSANIRIPHVIRNCSLFALDYIIDKNFRNTLVLSKPGAGKTTFIRDVIYQMSQRNYCMNVLVADERSEIASVVDGKPQISLGNYVDIYSNSTKEYAFKYGIRSMRPDILITDEIDIDTDLRCIVDAVNSGVKILATIHSDSISQLKNKRMFEKILADKIFERYILLTDDEGPGTLCAIYDDRLQCLYCR